MELPGGEVGIFGAAGSLFSGIVLTEVLILLGDFGRLVVLGLRGAAYGDRGRRSLNHSDMDGDCYRILGVDVDADLASIKKAYRVKVRRYHPDLNKHEGAIRKFYLIQRAYETLSDGARRRAYDRAHHPEKFTRERDFGRTTTTRSVDMPFVGETTRSVRYRSGVRRWRSAAALENGLLLGLGLCNVVAAMGLMWQVMVTVTYLNEPAELKPVRIVERGSGEGSGLGR